MKEEKFRIMLLAHKCYCSRKSSYNNLGAKVVSERKDSRGEVATYRMDFYDDLLYGCPQCTAEADRYNWPKDFIVPIYINDRVTSINTDCCGFEQGKIGAVKFVSGTKYQNYIVMSEDQLKPACYKCVKLFEPDLFDQVEW